MLWPLIVSVVWFCAMEGIRHSPRCRTERHALALGYAGLIGAVAILMLGIIFRP